MTYYPDATMFLLEIMLVRVCYRPEQHGADMLGPLHHLLNTCGDEKGSVVSALALEALYYLCEAEVCTSVVLRL